MVRVPTEYQEVEYIESTGTQYIDLPFGFDPTDEVYAKFSTSTKTYVDKYIVSPVTWNTDNNRFAMGVHICFACAFGVSNTSSTRLSPNTNNDGNIHEWRYRSSLFEIVDLDLSKDVSAIRFGSTSAILRLFYGYNSPTVGRIVSYHHKKADGTEINLIPCYRKSDNEIGMYDTVTGTFYTNQGTGTFIKGNDVTYDPISLLETRRKILLNTPHIESASGSTATFNADMSTNFTDLKIHFLPVQAGSGDPSPDNVRPITGWDGVTVTRCGKNLLKPSASLSGVAIRSSGTMVTTDARYNIHVVKVKPNTNYTMIKTGQGYYPTFGLLDKYPEIGDVVDGYESLRYRNTYTFNSSDHKYALFSFGVNDFNTIDIQVEEGSTATAYEPYTALEIPISFGRTIYGGYVDLVNGEVVEEWTKRNLNAFSQTLISGGGFQVGHWLSSGWEKANGTDNFISDVFKRVIGGTVDQTMKGYGNTYPILLYDSSITTVGEFKEKYADNYIVYAIRHPVTYPIDPQTLKALKGINNIWSDANGDVEVKFWKH